MSKNNAAPTCSICGEIIAYYVSHCRCSEFVGFPNVRKAKEECKELQHRYNVAQADCAARGALEKFKQVEQLALNARPTITMSFDACDGILRDEKYRTYEQRVVRGDRPPANEDDASFRAQVAAKLFPEYANRIAYAALAPRGHGLYNYGKISVAWHVTDAYLGRRISVHEENSFDFYERHGLGHRGAQAPKGFRATWEDRAKIAAAKLGGNLSNAVSNATLSDLFFSSTDDRNEDVFIEIAICTDVGVGGGGLDTRDVAVISFQSSSEVDEMMTMDRIRETCAKRQIDILESP